MCCASLRETVTATFATSVLLAPTEDEKKEERIMKKTFTLVIKRLFALLTLIFAQFKVWAVDTTTATHSDKSESIFSQPYIWIGIAVIIAIKLLGPFTQKKEEFAVIRKKDSQKKSL